MALNTSNAAPQDYQYSNIIMCLRTLTMLHILYVVKKDNPSSLNVAQATHVLKSSSVSSFLK